MSFAEWFETVTGFAPHTWQQELAEDRACRDRMLRIPTGFGKTAGTALAWMHHRVVAGDMNWPTRLVFCLPMRVLVEQTERAIGAWIQKANVDVGLVTLLGGRRETAWLERPEHPAIIVGTQDMLLSRALSRSYGSARGLWPMEMGLLHLDALWVVDEVQLMDVGLATTTQLHAFRAADSERERPALRPAHTWWMSATLQPRWLQTVDFAPRSATATETRIDAALRNGGLWDVRKPLSVRPDAGSPDEIAEIVISKHSKASVSLVIVNTVERARKVHEALTKRKRTAELVHSRFRGAERRAWSFLARDAPVPAEGRIIVATQVVEAGVDISAALLVTDLAPWSSLVQRFGRCARYTGERGDVVVVGAPADEKKSAPYSLAEITAAADALARLGADAGPASLESFEEGLARNDANALASLYPYTPLHVLRRRDFDDLFDTTPDLSGADLDVSRYIRSGEERDVTVFWRPGADTHVREVEVEAPSRDELCPVPVGELRDFIEKRHAHHFVRDYVSGRWKRPERLVPGMTVLLATDAGGYDAARGWDARSTAPVVAVQTTESESALARAAASADDEELSAFPWKTIATHGRETGEQARAIASALALEAHLANLLALAGRWHDAGKAHPTFQAAIRDDARNSGGELAASRELAKAPLSAWRRPAYSQRPGFRHELVSTLMMMELLRRAAPDHAAMLGPHRELLEAIGAPPVELSLGEQHAADDLTRELIALPAEDVDLVLYLVCAHHGKVRTSWSTTPNDQKSGHGDIHGVRDGDVITPTSIATANGGRTQTPELKLSLASAALGLNPRYGSSWAERVARLLDRVGPFALGYLEAILRAADWRASQLNTPEAP